MRYLLTWTRAQGQIEANCLVEDDALLGNVGNVVTEGYVAVSDVTTVDFYGAGVGSVEAFDEGNDGRFSCSAGTDESGELTWFDGEVQAVEDQGVWSGWLRELDLLEADARTTG